MGQTVDFDLAYAKRIDKVVKAFERTGQPALPPESSPPANSQTWYASLTAENPSSPGNYSWIRQYVIDGSLINSNPVVQDTGYSASDLNQTAGIPLGTIVEMRWAGYDVSGNPRYLCSFGGSNETVPVLLTKDGGNDGNASIGREATWTYTATDVNSGLQYAVQLPLYGHRCLAQQTTPAHSGTLIRVSSTSNIGYGGNQDITINLGNGTGFSGAGSGSGSGTTNQPYRLWSCDETFPMVDACIIAGSGSGSG